MLADDMAEQQHYSDIREAKEATCKELQEEMEQLQVDAFITIITPVASTRIIPTTPAILSGATH